MELKIPPVVQMILVAIAMWLVSVLLPSATYKSNGLLWVAGFFITAGLIVLIFGISAFRNASTTVDPRTPEKASSLVINGIYRISRNPMYLGILLLLIGWVFVLGSFLSLIGLPVFVLYINHYQIMPEEQSLGKIFNEEYLAYKKCVRRWI